MSIDDYEDDEELFWDDDEFDFIDGDEPDDDPGIDYELLHRMVKMTRDREAKEQEWALEEREKMLQEEANLCGPTFFDPKDLHLPEGKNI